MLLQLRGFFVGPLDRINDVRMWIRLGWDKNGVPINPSTMQTLVRGVWLEIECASSKLVLKIVARAITTTLRPNI